MTISNLAIDLNSIGCHWYTKMEPFYSIFVIIRMAALKPGKNVIDDDDRLIVFKKQLRNSIQIGRKASGLKFKIYSWYSRYYQYNSLFVSKIAKITKLKKKSRLTNSPRFFYFFCETLLVDWRRYLVFIDNFVGNVLLFTALR